MSFQTHNDRTIFSRLIPPGGFRLLALDLDGTVLTNDKRVTPRTAAALRRAVAAGLIPVLVTGRPLAGLPEALTELPGLRYAITSNGAVTTDRLSGEKLRLTGLDSASAAAIVSLPIRRGLIHGVFVDGVGYCEPDFYTLEWDFFKDTPLADYVRKSRRPTEDLAALIAGADGRIENIWLIAHDQTERDELDGIIRRNWTVRTVLTAARDVEVGSPEADKGLALQELAHRLGIEKRQILAIGDNENDLGMLREAGCAVAMGNATPAVLREADYITDTNENDGAAMVIEALLPG